MPENDPAPDTSPIDERSAYVDHRGPHLRPFVHGQMMRTPNFGKLAMAKAAAQAEFLPIARDKLAEIRSQKGNFDYTFADLAAVIEAVIPSLSKHGLALFTPITGQDFKAMEVIATILLVHGESEQWMQCDYKAAIADSVDPRKVGSASTYARRYGALAMLGINPKDEDDDGEIAEPRGAARGVERPAIDEHPNAPQKTSRPAPSSRTSEQTPPREPDRAPPAAETRTVPFEGGAQSDAPADDAFYTTLLRAFEQMGWPAMAGWKPDDVLEEWARKLGTFSSKPDLNKFAGPCISEAKKLAAKSTTCATIATKLAKAFNTRTQELSAYPAR